MKSLLTIVAFCACLLACGGPTPEHGSASVAGSGGFGGTGGSGGQGGDGGSGGDDTCTIEPTIFWTDGAWYCSVCECSGQRCFWEPNGDGMATWGMCDADLKCSAACPSLLDPP